MSKFLPQKKKLIEDVFEKASNETTETSFNGILKSLERTLLDSFKITLSYKTFETYYTQLVKKNEDYNIKSLTLDELSTYLGYNNFKEYCAEWKTIEYSIKESISNIVITIINKPLLKIPEFLTKYSSGTGIMGMILCFSILGENINVEKKEHCMYWSGKEYLAENCENTGLYELIAIDMRKINHFKKITQPDTITEKSLNKVWYSKYNNIVEFFTADGINPENGKELKPVSKYILENYISAK